jgi:hypothetical protein
VRHNGSTPAPLTVPKQPGRALSAVTAEVIEGKPVDATN